MDGMGGELRTVATTDGRTLEILTAGIAGGYPWLWVPGTPSAAVDFPWLGDLATKLGLRLVTWSRPGYGGSTPRPFPRVGPRIVDVPDIEAILDALGLDEFVVVGWSGGGPRALACAAVLSSRCSAAATFAGLAPFDGADLEWFAGMGPGNVADFSAALQGPEAHAAFQEKFFLPMTSADAADVAAGLGQLLTPTDEVSFTEDLARWLAETMHRAGAQGVIGVRDDGLALVAPWGFDVAASRCRPRSGPVGRMRRCLMHTASGLRRTCLEPSLTWLMTRDTSLRSTTSRRSSTNSSILEGSIAKARNGRAVLFVYLVPPAGSAPGDRADAAHSSA